MPIIVIYVSLIFNDYICKALNEYADNTLYNAIILYVYIVVTNVHTPYLRIVWTHLILVDILDVNGAAIHASPNL